MSGIDNPSGAIECPECALPDHVTQRSAQTYYCSACARAFSFDEDEELSDVLDDNGQPVPVWRLRKCGNCGSENAYERDDGTTACWCEKEDERL